MKKEILGFFPALLQYKCSINACQCEYPCTANAMPTIPSRRNVPGWGWHSNEQLQSPQSAQCCLLNWAAHPSPRKRGEFPILGSSGMGMEPPAGHCPQARGSSGAAWNGDGMEFYTAAEKWAMKLAWLSYTKKAPEVGVPERLKN